MKNELQTLRLFSPLFPHLYRRNEWGSLENDPEDLASAELLEYEVKVKLPARPYLGIGDTDLEEIKAILEAVAEEVGK